MKWLADFKLICKNNFLKDIQLKKSSVKKFLIRFTLLALRANNIGQNLYYERYKASSLSYNKQSIRKAIGAFLYESSRSHSLPFKLDTLV
jgi:hypothetical protein